jgi:hypothetical protein
VADADSEAVGWDLAEGAEVTAVEEEVTAVELLQVGEDLAKEVVEMVVVAAEMVVDVVAAADAVAAGKPQTQIDLNLKEQLETTPCDFSSFCF